MRETDFKLCKVCGCINAVGYVRCCQCGAAFKGAKK